MTAPVTRLCVICRTKIHPHQKRTSQGRHRHAHETCGAFVESHRAALLSQLAMRPVDKARALAAAKPESPAPLAPEWFGRPVAQACPHCPDVHPDARSAAECANRAHMATTAVRGHFR